MCDDRRIGDTSPDSPFIEHQNGGEKGECYVNQAVKEIFQAALASDVKWKHPIPNQRLAPLQPCFSQLDTNGSNNTLRFWQHEQLCPVDTI